jgi:hypothetical protein
VSAMIQAVRIDSSRSEMEMEESLGLCAM